QDLRDVGPSQIFEKIAAGLEHFSTQQEKALELAKLLPRGFLPLLPVLTQGLDKFQAAVKDAREVGALVTEGEVHAAENLEASFTKLKLSLTSLSRAVIEAFGPSVSVLLNNLAKTIATNRQAVVDLAKAIAVGMLQAIDVVSRGLIGLVRTIE